MHCLKLLDLSKLHVSYSDAFSAVDMTLRLMQIMCNLDEMTVDRGEPDPTYLREPAELPSGSLNSEEDNGEKEPHEQDSFQIDYNRHGLHFAKYTTMTRSTYREYRVDSLTRFPIEEDPFALLSGVGTRSVKLDVRGYLSLFLNTICKGTTSYRGVPLQRLILANEPAFADWSLVRSVLVQALKHVAPENMEEAHNVILANYDRYRSRGLMCFETTPEDIKDMLNDLKRITSLTSLGSEIQDWPQVKENPRLFDELKNTRPQPSKRGRGRPRRSVTDEPVTRRKRVRTSTLPQEEIPSRWKGRLRTT
uniref:PKW1 plasmid n=1 Tax=Kluyveromyces waltii TaxID=4914 RepID=Q01086_KLUWA|nr:unnamed protein product [Lachancea waltii]